MRNRETVVATLNKQYYDVEIEYTPPDSTVKQLAHKFDRNTKKPLGQIYQDGDAIFTIYRVKDTEFSSGDDQFEVVQHRREKLTDSVNDQLIIRGIFERIEETAKWYKGHHDTATIFTAHSVKHQNKVAARHWSNLLGLMRAGQCLNLLDDSVTKPAKPLVKVNEHVASYTGSGASYIHPRASHVAYESFVPPPLPEEERDLEVVGITNPFSPHYVPDVDVPPDIDFDRLNLAAIQSSLRLGPVTDPYPSLHVPQVDPEAALPAGFADACVRVHQEHREPKQRPPRPPLPVRSIPPAPPSYTQLFKTKP